MTAAILNLRIAPIRMLTRREAANYIGVPIKSFSVHCPVAPVQMPHNKLLFDVHDLDKFVDDLKGDNANNLDELIEGLPGK